MIIGFTGHRDKITDLFKLAGIQLDYPEAKWVHGGAKTGFDAQVHKHILRNQPGIPFEVFEPEYSKYPHNPKYAPIARNHKIVDMCDIMVACWDGRTRGGTFDTIQYCKDQLLVHPVIIIFVEALPLHPKKIKVI